MGVGGRGWDFWAAGLFQRGPEGGPHPGLDKQALYPSPLPPELSLLSRGKENGPSLLPEPSLVSQCRGASAQ